MFLQEIYKVALVVKLFVAKNYNRWLLACTLTNGNKGGMNVDA